MSLCQFRVAVAASVILGFAAGSAHAALQTLEGRYLQVSYDDALLPAGFGNVQLRESALNWACSEVSCALTGPLSAAVVFGTADGQPLATTSQALDFNVTILPKMVDNIVDPLGHNWGTVAADLAKWGIGVDIASQSKPAGDAQFATAYGQFSYSADSFGFFLPRFPYRLPSMYVRAQETTVLGLSQDGLVGLGAGSPKLTTLNQAGRVLWEENPDTWRWTFSTKLDGARWAFPSTTDLLCASLSCMTFKTGSVNVNSYVLSFGLVGTPSAVPEAGTLPLMVMGLLGVSLLARRRQR